MGFPFLSFCLAWLADWIFGSLSPVIFQFQVHTGWPKGLSADQIIWYCWSATILQIMFMSNQTRTINTVYQGSLCQLFDKRYLCTIRMPDTPSQSIKAQVRTLARQQREERDAHLMNNLRLIHSTKSSGMKASAHSFCFAVRWMPETEFLECCQSTRPQPILGFTDVEWKARKNLQL